MTDDRRAIIHHNQGWRITKKQKSIQILVKNLFFEKMDHREREGVEKSKEDRSKERRRNKPDQATMRPDCVSACIDFGARLGRTDRWKDKVP